VLAGETDLANPRRVVRALELATLRGDGPRPALPGYPAAVRWLGLDLADRPLHRAWIRDRAAGQFAAGLLDEARALRERWDPTRPAFSAIGYHEAWAVLDGKATLTEAVELDIGRNVAFARRQRTWFRREPDVEWLDAADADTLERGLAIARRLIDESLS
jgi:tRNA dimethylallyltransferase